MSDVTPTVGDLLLATPVFRKLSRDDRQRIAPFVQLRTYEPGQQIVAQGEPSNALYTVARGRVSVVKTTQKGVQVPLEICGVGDPIGGVLFYSGFEFAGSAVALEPTSCLVIERAALFGLLERHPSLVRGLLLGLTQQLFDVRGQLAELTAERVPDQRGPG